MQRIATVVLAGGFSRRMGHDKAQLQLPDGRSTLETVVTTSSSVTELVIVSVNSREQAATLRIDDRIQYQVLQDEQPGGGPLAALVGAFNALPDLCGVLLVAVDAPIVLPSVLQRLALAFVAGQDPAPSQNAPRVEQIVDPELGVERIDVTAPEFSGIAQPLPACYAVRLAPIARQLLREGRRSLRSLLEHPDVHTLVLGAEFLADGGDLLSLRGANTPAEWNALLERARRG